MTEPRWNQIPGLTQEQNNWIDDLAHGLVTQEALDWITGVIEVFMLTQEGTEQTRAR